MCNDLPVEDHASPSDGISPPQPKRSNIGRGSPDRSDASQVFLHPHSYVTAQPTAHGTKKRGRAVGSSNDNFHWQLTNECSGIPAGREPDFLTIGPAIDSRYGFLPHNRFEIYVCTFVSTN